MKCIQCNTELELELNQMTLVQKTKYKTKIVVECPNAECKIQYAISDVDNPEYATIVISLAQEYMQ